MNFIAGRNGNAGFMRLVGVRGVTASRPEPPAELRVASTLWSVRDKKRRPPQPFRFKHL